jgi:hypothetical protein
MIAPSELVSTGVDGSRGGHLGSKSLLTYEEGKKPEKGSKLLWANLSMAILADAIRREARAYLI